jgi:two-component system sensor kinase FixL
MRLLAQSDHRLYVRADPWWIKQALRVITENAINAMKESNTRILTITTQATDDGYIKINLADTGPGISPDLLERLFKGSIKSGGERGRGLGAAIAAIIVENYDGMINVEENSESGANVVVLLPRAR